MCETELCCKVSFLLQFIQSRKWKTFVIVCLGVRKYVNEDSHNVIEHLEILLNNIRNQWEDGCLSKLYVL